MYYTYMWYSISNYFYIDSSSKFPCQCHLIIYIILHTVGVGFLRSFSNFTWISIPCIEMFVVDTWFVILQTPFTVQTACPLTLIVLNNDFSSELSPTKVWPMRRPRPVLNVNDSWNVLTDLLKTRAIYNYFVCKRKNFRSWNNN